MTVLVGIDPGHGGDKHGACHGGIVEKDYNLNLSRGLKNHMLRVFGEGGEFRPVLLRNRDVNMGLRERGEWSREMGCALVVSIHVNAYHNAFMRTALGFHWPDDILGKEVCEAILRAWPRDLMGRARSWEATDNPTPDDDWLERPRDVLEPHQGRTAILIEVGYCSNSQDAQALYNPWVRDGMLPAFMCGLFRYGQLNDQA
jgi:N-acetylmuramoyl-L-alanine amidase